MSEPSERLYFDSHHGKEPRHDVTHLPLRRYGMKVAGDVMIARTNPPQHQQMAVRRELLKMICLMHEFQEILLETADKHKQTVMPGYTHIRHAQPTT